MKTKKPLTIFLLLTFIFLNLGRSAAELNRDDLEKNFVTPPDSVRPWVFWNWINGNITKEGVTADLEAMKRVGIGGVQIFEVAMGVPKGPLDFMSPEWQAIFKFVASEAQRLGLEIDLSYDAGWCGSGGGPWIPPEKSMQQVVFSEKQVEGPQDVALNFPCPAVVSNYYRDIRVLAFPTPSAYRIKNIKTKAMYAKPLPKAPAPETHTLAPGAVIKKEAILDLTKNLDGYGHFKWNAPAGKWTILRVGHTSTGSWNGPNPPAAGKGLQCDKLSQSATTLHFDSMIRRLASTVGPEFSGTGKAWGCIHIDSWESGGTQNWTADMPTEFYQRCGYQIFPFLPVLSGRVVGSLELSERFLQDLRKTISDLMIENFAGHTQALAHKKGLNLSIEHYGRNPCDNLTFGSKADYPETEFWTGRTTDAPEPASAAHIYGKNIVGAEAFTSNEKEKWQVHPGLMKAQGDWEFCRGVNRIIFHRYAMQPWTNRAPGMAMGPYGVHYERTETWWEQSKAWHLYLARCQLLLRQGLWVADILRLQSEEPQLTARDPKPYGDYAFDVCSPDCLLTRVTVREGRLMLPDGLSYRLLVLPAERYMSPGLLGKIRELVRAGATIVGPPPQKSFGLRAYPQSDDEVKKLTHEIWGDCDGINVKDHALGKGRVYWGHTPPEVLAKLNIPPDFSSIEELNGLHYAHRRTGTTDIYFVAVTNREPTTLTAEFRVTGRHPQLWNPESGQITPVLFYEEKDGCTQIPLRLQANGSIFVVFRPDGMPKLKSLCQGGEKLSLAELGGLNLAVKTITTDQPASLEFDRSGDYELERADGTKQKFQVGKTPEQIELAGTWVVEFPPHLGAPPKITLDKLVSLSEQSDPGVKYFSGTATYIQSFSLPATGKNHRWYLHLGDVQVMAEVILNGKNLGVLWHTPYVVDISEAAHPGVNQLIVKVTNLWINRMIGDEQLADDCEHPSPDPLVTKFFEKWNGEGTLKEFPAWLTQGKPSPTGRITFSVWRLWKKEEPLKLSGLLGPVSITATESMALPTQ